MLVMTKKTEDELRELIRLNMDAVRGFSLAAKRADDLRHASLFEQLAAARRANEITLRELGRRHGVDVHDLDTHAAADTHRAWIEAVDAISESDEALLNECLRGEEQIAQEYAEADRQHMWPRLLDSTLRAQREEILDVTRELRLMRERLD